MAERKNIFNAYIVSIVAIVGIVAILVMIVPKFAPVYQQEDLAGGATEFVVNSNGKVEQGRAAEGDAVAIAVELDLPSYYPDFLRHPQKFFSGQPLKITAPAFPDHASVTLADIATGKQQSVTAKQSKERLDKARISGKTAFSFTPPDDLTTGQYRISFAAGRQTYQLQLAINGLTAAEKDISGAISIPDLLQRIAIRFRSQICTTSLCYWEMVFGGNPTNSNELFQVGIGQLSRSLDGGRMWNSANINDITNYPDPQTYYYWSDPKIAPLSDSSFYLTGIVTIVSLPHNVIGGGFYSGSQQGGLQFTTFKPVPSSVPPDIWFVADFPKIAVHQASSTNDVYIAANAVWFDATQYYGKGLFVSHDAGRTFAEYPLTILYGGLIDSITVGSGGELYATYLHVADTDGNIPTVIRFTSIEPPAMSEVPLPAFTTHYPPKISATSTRGWIAYYGPEIVADTSTSSPHRGRLYVAWAQEEKTVADPNFEYSYYGYNFDVFVSYSDDKGQTWSPKVKVNDDSGAGDQFFPSMRLDANGVLSVAFVDHRNNQNLPVFDIYYAKSSDGVKFSKNLRVNTDPISNNPVGGRTIGDYLDMVAAYPTRVYIAYPCGQSDSGPTGACMAQVDPRLVR